jgi:hypothetical protein
VTILGDQPSSTPRPDAAASSVAGTFLEGLAAQDFDRLASVLSDDVHLSALLPGGLKERDGVGAVETIFTRWFGDSDEFELVDTSAGEIGTRLNLRWRVRMRAERLGPGWFVVEQQAYADRDDDGRIRNLSLVCSGYCAEEADA